jgi:hypothetical protein
MSRTYDDWNRWWELHRSSIVTTVPACGKTLMTAALSLSRIDPADEVAVKQLFGRIIRARRTLLHAVAGLDSAREWLGERELKRLPQGWAMTIVDDDSEPPDADAYHAWAWLSDNALRFADVGEALRVLANAAEGVRRATEKSYERRASDAAAAIFELQAAIVRIDPGWIKNEID